MIEVARRVGVEVHREDDAVGTGKLWRVTPLIIVDLEAARSVRRCRLPRRPGVIVLATEHGSDAWATAEVLGASYLAVWPTCETWLADRFAEITT